MNLKNIRNIDLEDFYKFHLPKEKIKFLLNFAVLAPSTHNSQPWLFKIKENSCEIYFDFSLKIPQADPEGRDLFISIGCAVENLILAAKYFNVFESLDYKFSANLVGEIKFKNLKENNRDINFVFKKIVNTIPKRINARGIFRDEFISQDVTKKVFQEISKNRLEYDIDALKTDFIDDKRSIRKIAQLTGEGIKIAYKSKAFRKEMSGWVHSSFTFKKNGLPGYSLRMPFFISPFFSILVRYFNIGNKLAWLNSKSIESSSLICIISGNQQEKLLCWTRVGRLAERLMLEFNKEGYNTSIFVASIEMGELYKQIKQLVNIKERPQFLFAVGKIESTHRYSPRIDLREKIIK